MRIIDTLWDRVTRNDINDNFKELFQDNSKIKNTLNDLIVEGHLNEEQLGVVLLVLNEAIKKGEVSVYDINKNKGLLDQTFMTDEFLQQIAGESSINAVPADGSLTTNKYSNQSVTPEKTSFFAMDDNNLFDGDYERWRIITPTEGMRVEEDTGDNSSRIAIIPVAPNTTYTVKSHDVDLTDTFRIGLSNRPFEFSDYGIFNLDSGVVMGDNSVPDREYTFETTKNSCLVFIHVSDKGNEPTLKVEKGSEATDIKATHINPKYIKEIDLRPGSVGTNVLMDETVTPKKTTFFRFDEDNLFDGQYRPWVLRVVGDIMRIDKTYGSEKGGLAIIPVEPNTTYTVKSHEIEKTNVFRIGLSNRPFEFSDYDIYNLSDIVVDGDTSVPEREYTFTTNSDSELVFIYVSNHGKSPRLKVEKGDKPTDYIVGGKIDSKYLDIGEVSENKIAKKVKSLTSKEMYSVPTLEGVNKPDSTTIIHNLTSDDMFSFYDGLMAEYPTYITKELFTTETTGQPIYKYNFEPEQAETDKEVYETDFLHLFIVSGVHASEKAAWWCLYQVMKQICDNWRNSNVLEDLRWNVKFSVVPIVNVYGVDHADDPITLNGKKNANGIDINRSFPVGFVKYEDTSYAGYGGEETLTQPEAIAMADFLKNEKVDYYADFHNFSTNSNPNAFMWNVSSDKFNFNMSRSYFSSLSAKWKKDDKGFPQRDGDVFGISSSGTGGSTPPFVADLGILGGIFEISHTMHPKDDPSQYSSEVVTLGTEAQLNWLYMAYKNLTN